MSAIACKILICREKASAVTIIPELIVGDLENKPDLANEIIKTQDKYVAKMDKLLEEFNNG